MDFNIKLSNGQVLKGMIESPGETTKAVVLLVHGLGEHVQRYNYWAGLFKKEGIGFAGVDLPGHGRSEGRRGYIKNYAQLGEMIDILLATCRKTFPGTPVFLYGHSLGGVIVLDYLIRKNPKIKGAIATSPFLRLAFEPPKIKLFLASVMKGLLPGLIQPSGLNADHLSQDKAVVERYKNDPLVHGKISVGLFHGTMKAAKFVLANAADLKISTLILHGSADLIISPEGSREFAGKSKMVELKIWNDCFHEPHNEPFRDEVFEFIMSWINKQLA
jgi:acylglycerol lipase